MALVIERFVDFGPTLACEKLAECHGMVLAKETARRWMRDAGLWFPCRQRPLKIYQPDCSEQGSHKDMPRHPARRDARSTQVFSTCPIS